MAIGNGDRQEAMARSDRQEAMARIVNEDNGTDRQ
jgi:hypothetical protein